MRSGLRFWLGCAPLVVCLAGCQREPSLTTPPGYDALRASLLEGGEFRHYPTLDPTGRWMVFARDTRTGVEYACLDLRDKSVSVLATHIRGNYQDTVATLYAWSPEGRWLAWVEPAGAKTAWTVKVRDLEQGVTAATGLKLDLRDMVWLGPDRLGVQYGGFLLPVERRGGQWQANYGRRFDLLAGANRELIKANPQATRLRDIDWKTLTPTGPDRAAFAVEGNLWELNTRSGDVTRLTDWAKGKVKWLDYSTSRQSFLFSTPEPADAETLSLLKWDRDAGAEARPLRLTGPGINALKGRWLADGYAYVSDDDDQARLVAVSDSGAATTNFADGSVWSYEACDRGSLLAAIASEAMEPLGLWKLDPFAGDQERLLAPAGYAPRIDRHSATGPDGQRVNYTVFRPEAFQPGRQYPVLFIPAHGRMWEVLSRVMPRLDVIQIMPAMNANGMQAYGKVDVPRAAEGVRAVWQDAARRYPVDTNRFYLQGVSYSTSVLPEIVGANPGVFRGLIADSPGALPDPGLLREHKLELLVTIGTDDETYAHTKEYVARLRAEHLLVWFVPIAGMEHSVSSTEHLEQRVRAAVSFIHRSAPATPTPVQP